LQELQLIKICDVAAINVPEMQGSQVLDNGTNLKFVLHLVQVVAEPEQAAQIELQLRAQLLGIE
jgi:hypothetical protein